MVPVFISAGLPQSALAIEQLAAFRRLHASIHPCRCLTTPPHPTSSSPSPVAIQQ